MKRLTIVVAAMLATLLVMRPPLFAQTGTDSPDMGGAVNDPGQDSGDQQAAPGQEPGGGDDTVEQNNDPNAASDENDPNGQNDPNGDQTNTDAGTGDDTTPADQ